MVAFTFLAVVSFAQQDAAPPAKPEAEKAPAFQPPPEVDQALRTRVNEFYTMMVSHEFRKAEAWVAEDTKDYYYDGAKPDIHNFEFVKADFTDLTHAKVTVKATEMLIVAGFPPAELKMTVPTLWKVENGQWVVYEDAKKIANPNDMDTKIQQTIQQVKSAINSTPAMPAEIPKEMTIVVGRLRLDKNEITLHPNSTETVRIFNSANGPFTLQNGYPLKGVDVKIDPVELGPGKIATVTFKAGPEPTAGAYTMRVMPTEDFIAIKVDVK